MTFEEASHALMKDLKTRLAELHGHFDAQNVDWHKLHQPLAKLVSEETQKSIGSPEVVEVRPKELECDVVRYQNNKEKWVALVGLLNGHPYEIFTGLQDEDEGIMLPSLSPRARSSRRCSRKDRSDMISSLSTSVATRLPSKD